MRIGVIGTRGVPNRYGGFERFLEVLVQHEGWRASGIRFIIYGEESDRPYNDWTDLRQVGVGKNARPLAYYARSTALACRECDAVLCCGVGISVFALQPRLSGKPLIVNPDGCEWRRTKWSALGRQLIRAMYAPALAAAQHIVIDAEALREDFGAALGRKARYIAYQAPAPQAPALRPSTREALKLSKAYALVIARLEPENNVGLVLDAFSQLPPGTLELLVVGPTSTPYFQSALAHRASGRIRFLGPIFDQEVLNELRSNCVAYVHGHSVGGTNPSLLEALATVRGQLLCHDNKYNREVAAAEAGYFRNAGALTELLLPLNASAPGTFPSERQPTRDLRFHPDTIFESYLKLFEDVRAAGQHV